MVPRHARIGTPRVIRTGTEMLRGWENPGVAPSGRTMQKEWLLRKLQAEAKPFKAENEDEGRKGCSKLRREPGAGSRDDYEVVF